MVPPRASVGALQVSDTVFADLPTMTGTPGAEGSPIGITALTDLPLSPLLQAFVVPPAGPEPDTDNPRSVAVVAPVTGTGVNELFPQHLMVLSVRSAQVLSKPMAIAVAVVIPVTVTGSDESVVVPFPSCP
jgi:hypothetical protein